MRMPLLCRKGACISSTFSFDEVCFSTGDILSGETNFPGFRENEGKLEKLNSPSSSKRKLCETSGAKEMKGNPVSPTSYMYCNHKSILIAKPRTYYIIIYICIVAFAEANLFDVIFLWCVATCKKMATGNTGKQLSMASSFAGLQF